MSKKRAWIPAALAVVAITATGARAQTTSPVTVPTTSPVVVSPNGGSNLGTQFPSNQSGQFGNSNQFGQFGNSGQFGNFNQFGNFDPRLNFDGSSLGFTPGVTPGNQFLPGFGNGGYYYNNYNNGSGYSGPMFNSMGPWANQNNFGLGIQSGGRVPIAGLNSPPIGRGPRYANIRNDGSGSGYDYQSQARADAMAQQRAQGTAAVTGPDTQQARISNQMENLMENRPLTQGTVVGPKQGTLVVRYQNNGESRINRFSPSSVYYFGSSGRMATANSASLPPGTSVLIPMPTAAEYRQAVAGSRQVYKSSKTKAKKSHKTW